MGDYNIYNTSQDRHLLASTSKMSVLCVCTQIISTPPPFFPLLLNFLSYLSTSQIYSSWNKKCQLSFVSENSVLTKDNKCVIAK